MPVEVSWYAPGYIIYQKYKGEMSLDELREAGVASSQLVQQAQPSPAKAYFVLDLSAVHSVSVAITQIRYDKNKHFMDPSMDWAVIVRPTEKSLLNQVNFISRALTYMFGYLFHICDSVDEGLAFLAERDPMLKRFIPQKDDSVQTPES